MSIETPNRTFPIWCLALCIVAAMLFATASDGNAGPEKAKLGRVMWAAFSCSTFAGMSNQDKEKERLFQIGLSAGRDFLKSLQGGDIPRDAISKEVPIGVTILLRGPSVDFIIGRVYSSATSIAHKKAWTNDDTVRVLQAGNEYRDGNCGLLR